MSIVMKSEVGRMTKVFRRIMSGARRERVERRRDGGTVEEEEADGGSREPSGEERDGTVSGGTGKENDFRIMI